MALTNLSKRTVGDGFEYAETIATGATGNTVLIPPYVNGKMITCRLICGANTGKIQTSTSLDEAVADGTCTWEDHPDGDVTGTLTDIVAGPITGIRAVSSSGEIVFEMVV